MIRRLLDNFMRSGIIFVAEKDNKLQGMLIAQVVSDVWLPHVKTMREVAWWVEPEHRHSTMGYRLLKEYVKTGETLQDKEVIEGFTLTNMEQSPDFDLKKRGWQPIETNYIYEGV